MRSIRPLREWPRALSARRLVLLATVASLGVAAAAVGPNVFHQAKLPTYATANAAESTQRPVGFADLEPVPPELNRQDSHGVRDRRFYRH